MLSEADETLLLAFLRRARGIIGESSWGKTGIGILDWHVEGSAGTHRADSLALADLADEWDAKFRADYFAFIGADADGNVPFHFRTFAHNESEHWELGGTPLQALAPFPIYGVYLIREGDHFRYGDFLENVFCYPSEPDDAPTDTYGRTPLQAFFDSNEGSEMVHLGEGWEGIRLPDPDKMDGDPRLSERHTFTADAGELALGELEVDDLRSPECAREAILDKLADLATEGAREWFQGNQCHPRVTFGRGV